MYVLRGQLVKHEPTEDEDEDLVFVKGKIIRREDPTENEYESDDYEGDEDSEYYRKKRKIKRKMAKKIGSKTKQIKKIKRKPVKRKMTRKKPVKRKTIKKKTKKKKKTKR